MAFRSFLQSSQMLGSSRMYVELVSISIVHNAREIMRKLYEVYLILFPTFFYCSKGWFGRFAVCSSPGPGWLAQHMLQSERHQVRNGGAEWCSKDAKRANRGQKSNMFGLNLVFARACFMFHLEFGMLQCLARAVIMRATIVSSCRRRKGLILVKLKTPIRNSCRVALQCCNGCAMAMAA